MFRRAGDDGKRNLGRHGTCRKIRHARAFSVRLESLLVLAILIVALSILSPYFLSVSNFLNILLATSAHRYPRLSARPS